MRRYRKKGFKLKSMWRDREAAAGLNGVGGGFIGLVSWSVTRGQGAAGSPRRPLIGPRPPSLLAPKVPQWHFCFLRTRNDVVFSGLVGGVTRWFAVLLAGLIYHVLYVLCVIYCILSRLSYIRSYSPTYTSCPVYLSLPVSTYVFFYNLVVFY